MPHEKLEHRHVSVENPFASDIKLQIEDRVFEKYPETKVAYLVANVNSDPDLSALLGSIRLKVASELKKNGVTKDNYKSHPDYTRWLNAYAEFGVTNKKMRKKFKPSICALLDMYFDDKLNTLYPMVDLYNLISIMHMMPMGAYDFNSVRGCNLTLRYGVEGEEFIPVGRSPEPVGVLDSALCYALYDVADYHHIATYMMNWKDSANFAVREDSKQIIFFADQLIPSDLSTPEATISELRLCLEGLGLTILSEGVVDKAARSLTVELPKENDIGLTALPDSPHVAAGMFKLGGHGGVDDSASVPAASFSN